MKTKTIKWFSRVAMMLLMTMLTTATAWADDVNLTENTNETEGTAERWFVNIPKTGENKLTLTDASIIFFKVYDNGGGPQNHYDNDCDGSLVLTAPEGCVLRLSGTIITEKGCDYLTVYDGNAKDDKKVLLNKVSSSSSGAETTIDAVTSTGQSMTLYFHSDNLVHYFGLNLTVTVVNLSEKFTITVSNPEAGGTIEASVGGTVAAQAAMTEGVTLTATPASGYLLSSVSVLDADSNPIAVDCNFSTNIATFTMPRSAVTVTPTFTDTWTAEGGFFINMPKAGDKLITIPAGMQSFKIYDDGGAGERYSNNCDGTLTLTAPEGYVLQLSGSIRTENTRDNLTVYDGSDNSGTVLIDALFSYSNNTERTIPTVNSTGQSLTLYFYSDGSDNFAGLDLTATLVSTSTDYDITLSNPITGGSVSASIGENIATQAKINDVITLTATPESNYLLSNISVVDANSNPVAVKCDGSFDNTATFSMPLSAVTVTPTFTDTWTAEGGLYVNMPKTGDKSITIPMGVQSFKVYDDGGAGERYSDNCNSTLTLKAPEGYALRLSGQASIQRSFWEADYLSVYDGSTKDENKLLINKMCNEYFDGTPFTIPTVNSTGQSMTIYFYSDDFTTYSGLNLTVSVIPHVALADNADNSSLIATAATSGETLDVTLVGRTLTKDGYWNTLCLPFSLTATQIAASPLAGATIKTMDNSNTGTSLSDAGALTLKFNTVDAIEAGKPYIVKWETTGDNIVNPTFSNVTISSTTPTPVENYDQKVTFVGQYSPFSIVANDALLGDNQGHKNEIIMMATKNNLGYSQTTRQLKCFRCHFYVPANDGELSARSIVVDFGDGETTEIGTINNNRETIANNQWYTLDGRKLTGKPTTKGVYIHNGRKEVVR